MLTDEYGTDPQITGLVDSREVWIVFDLNPDGGEYDIATGITRPGARTASRTPARRHRHRPEPQLGLQWGCCGGSSGTPSSETYRGPAAVLGARDAGGARLRRQPRRSAASSRSQPASTSTPMASWCSGPSATPSPKCRPDMSQDDHTRYVAMGQAMAATNGYTPGQASELYITDGDDRRLDVWRPPHPHLQLRDVPGDFGQRRLLPRDEVIPAQTARNRAAVLYLLEHAACPYAVIGKEAQYCEAPLTTIFAGDVAQVSPPIGLTGGANFGLSFKYRFGHSRTSSRADYLRVRVIGNVTRTVFHRPRRAPPARRHLGGGGAQPQPLRRPDRPDSGRGRRPQPQERAEGRGRRRPRHAVLRLTFLDGCREGCVRIGKPGLSRTRPRSQ